MAMKKEYYTCNRRIVGEKRAGEERSRDYITDHWWSVIAIYQTGWQIAAITYDLWCEQLSNRNSSSYRCLWGGSYGYRQTNKEWASHYIRAIDPLPSGRLAELSESAQDDSYHHALMGISATNRWRDKPACLRTL